MRAIVTTTVTNIIEHSTPMHRLEGPNLGLAPQEKVCQAGRQDKHPLTHFQRQINMVTIREVLGISSSHIICGDWLSHVPPHLIMGRSLYQPRIMKDAAE